MKHGSLFTGIGGFDLASEWMGWENVFHCEWNKFAQKILQYYWSNSISYGDITKTDFTIHKGKIDILTGGFPCQPFSQAGKRLGKEDDRHLWPEMLRAIREIQPPWIVGENVHGLLNWNGGLVFDEVQIDLENEGYEVQPIILPACAKDAPHRRDRIWFVAYDSHKDTNSEQEYLERKDGNRPKYPNEKEVFQRENDKSNRQYKISSSKGVITNPNSSMRTQRKKIDRFQKPKSKRDKLWNEFGASGNTNIESYSQNRWEKFPTQPPVCSRNDGIPRKLDGITFPKWRNQSIQAYGNAIVPQVAYEIFKAIKTIND